ncbi:acyl-CoA synthetase (AMP-forming)/AMP-acid ligase II [Kibdelosporangium banguiense]|uniref:Acyl-CoA synthetase (AMP-forming)/AMP-acid ligase II n=1 Tax=Kibdelosporangium banguiense TaxID=1365924 RepID=A0ABS4TNE9_9PSEU|nr:class I adenylate-forming enzyme family protein [Kibdelosporangium banguiense]MBP2325939.1 acyl-CoA synthetase (AMP-forming)/AMP-acid ligase II [Kibdelosporangium banguiense]
MGLHPADRVAEYTSRGWWADETIDSLFTKQVAARPDALAVVDAPNKPTLAGLPAARWTFAELDAEVDRIGAALRRHGVRPGDVVGVQLPNIAELVATFLAIVRIGAVASPLPVQFREHELTTLPRIANFSAFVTAATVGDRKAAEIISGLGHDMTVLAFGSPLPDNVIALDSEPQASVEPHPIDPNDCVTICWTSGTEATPKGVPRSHYDWIAIAEPCAGAPRLTAEDVLLNPFPVINMAAIAGTLIPWLRTGCVYALHHPFDLPTFLSQLTAEHVTYTLAPPALLTMLLHNENILSTVDISALRAIGSGSAPLPESMVRGWQERHGIAVINFFGSNEGVCLLSAPEDFPDPDIRARYFPRYGVSGMSWSAAVGERLSLRLVDASGTEITEPGVPGELRIKGPTVFAGYLPGTAEKDPFDEQGYLRTGDVFEIAGEDGQYLRYVDRSKDIIIRGGMNIAPAEVENLLAGHPDVAEVAIIGVPHEVLGEQACAVVVPAAGAEPSPQDLLDFLQSRKIASYKLPERFEFTTALPRNPVGKVLKRELRKKLAG